MPGVRVAHSMRVRVRHPKHAGKARRCRRRIKLRRRAHDTKSISMSISVVHGFNIGLLEHVHAYLSSRRS